MVHRDLKPQNICLTSKYQPKIIDMGLAVTKASSQRYLANTKAAGTAVYR